MDIERQRQAALLIADDKLNTLHNAVYRLKESGRSGTAWRLRVVYNAVSYDTWCKKIIKEMYGQGGSFGAVR